MGQCTLASQLDVRVDLVELILESRLVFCDDDGLGRHQRGAVRVGSRWCWGLLDHWLLRRVVGLRERLRGLRRVVGSRQELARLVRWVAGPRAKRILRELSHLYSALPEGELVDSHPCDLFKVGQLVELLEGDIAGLVYELLLEDKGPLDAGEGGAPE